MATDTGDGDHALLAMLAGAGDLAVKVESGKLAEGISSTAKALPQPDS